MSEMLIRSTAPPTSRSRTLCACRFTPGPSSQEQPADAGADQDRDRERGRSEPQREALAERADLHGEELDVDHRTDDEERQPRGERELAQRRGDERVGLRAERED